MWTCKLPFQNDSLASTPPPQPPLRAGATVHSRLHAVEQMDLAWYPHNSRCDGCLFSFVVACYMWESAVSKGRVSFIALSARKRNLRGCVEVLHRAWSSSRCVRMSWKNVLAKHLGGGRGFTCWKIAQGMSRQSYCITELLQYKIFVDI